MWEVRPPPSELPGAKVRRPLGRLMGSSSLMGLPSGAAMGAQNGKGAPCFVCRLYRFESAQQRSAPRRKVAEASQIEGARALEGTHFLSPQTAPNRSQSVQKCCQVFIGPDGALRLAGPCRSHGRWLGALLEAADGLLDSEKQVCDGEQGPGVTFTSECMITMG